MGNRVPYRPRHGESWAVDVLHPETLRPTEPASPVLGLGHFASPLVDAFPLGGVVWLVVGGELLDSDAVGFVERYQNAAGVAYVGGVNGVSVEEDGGERGARQLYVENRVRLLVVLKLDH